MSGRAIHRMLIVSDVIGATQSVNFTRPFAAAVRDGEADLKLLSADDLQGFGDNGLKALWSTFEPTALIFSRYSEGGHEAPVALARAAGVPIVHHIDDDLFAVPETLGKAKHQYYNAARRLRNLRAAVEASDVVYASTRPLADRLRAHGVLRPIIAGEIACAVNPARFPAPTPRPWPVIGYMATAGHLRDFELAAPAIATLLAEIPNATVEIFGSLRLPKPLRQRFAGRLVQHDPLPDYDAFLEKLGELGWWIGLAPLELTEFNNCKTDIKWLEYSFAGIPTLASDGPVYRACCSGGGGMLAPDESCWTSSIRTLLSQERLRQDVVAQARARVARDYTLDRLRRQVEDVLSVAAEVAGRRSGAGKTIAPPASVDETPTPQVRPPGPRPNEYERWVATFDELSQADWRRLDDLADELKESGPTICVVVPPGASPPSEEDLQRSIGSVLAQIYPNWRLLAACSAPAPGDRRIRFEPDARDLGALLDRAEGEFLCFLEPGDVLAPHALMSLALHAGRHAGPSQEKFDLLYTDEDEIDAEGRRSQPWFKGDWDPDLFLGQDYVSRLVMIRTSEARTLDDGLPPLGLASVYALLLRLLARAAKLRVGHTPLVLYHRKSGRTPGEAVLRLQDDAVRDCLEARAGDGAQAQVQRVAEGRRILWPLPDPQPLVSLVIPTRDRVELLRNCVDGILNATDYRRLELILVDNDSTLEETLQYISTIASDPRVRCFYQPGPFNYSAINNFGVRQARGEVIGLLNNDLEVIEPTWLNELVSQALRPDVGAVGPMLHYGDGTVQHAGIVLGVGGVASHIFKRQPPGSAGYRSRLALAQELSAVTGACMVLRREVWDEAGGLDEDLPVAFNDVDLCLRIRAAGYRNIWTPFARLRHLESVSRGKDIDLERRARFDQDRAKMKLRWGEVLTNDPFFSPNLSMRSVDARPAFPPRVTWPWWNLPTSGV